MDSPPPPLPDPARVRSVARRLWDLVEPLAGSVILAPETRAAYGALGLVDERAGYFCGRAACMGAVPGEVVAAALAVFNPEIVVPAVAGGWARSGPGPVLAARAEAARLSLTRVLGEGADSGRLARATELMERAGRAARPEGRPVFAALRAVELPDDPFAGLWQAADILREHRGGSHVLAWTAMHLSPVEMLLLTELWWRQAPGPHTRSRGWTAEETAAGLASLRDRGFTAGEPPVFTTEGEHLRAVVEGMTDQGETEVVRALGTEAEELLDLLAPWADAVLAARAYPRDPASFGRG